MLSRIAHALRGGSVMILLLAAMVAGGALGAVHAGAAEIAARVTDPLVLMLVGALFFTLRWGGWRELRRSPRIVLLVLGVNFLVVPVIAFGLTRNVPDEALRLGVLLYCLAPCTDWFLGFARLAGGDILAGTALIPVQMLLQAVLYPLWLFCFAGADAGSGAVAGAVAGMGEELPLMGVAAIWGWFVLPAALGAGARLLLRRLLPVRWRSAVLAVVDRAIPFLIAAVILAIFAGNVTVILADTGAFLGVLLVVFAFFVVIYLLGEAVARVLRLAHAEHALVTMATSARNAPLMLAMTAVALPDQPVVAAAIVIGMLVEFPHLTVLTQVLRRQSPSRSASRCSGASDLRRGNRVDIVV